MENSIESGDLVYLFMYSPHDSELACTPLHTGIFLDYADESHEPGWTILVDGKTEVFFKQWWKIKPMQKQEHDERNK
jgi:hypothetical protein